MSRFLKTTPAIEQLAERVARGTVVALDTEFHTERWYRPRLMLVQIRVDGEEPCLVDPLAGARMDALGEALAVAPVVVHGGAYDADLIEAVCGRRPNVVFDTQIAAGCLREGYPERLQDLVRRHLGRDMDKGQTLSDWSQRPLSDAQARYAAEDVMVLAPLAEILRRRIESDGDADFVARATAEAFEGTTEADEDVWVTLPGAAWLGDRERAALQALAAWREAEARDRDQPRHAVISDAVLVDLARRRPSSLDAMRANRRLPGQVWKREGEAVLAALRRAERAPTPPAPIAADRARHDFLRAGLRVVEDRTGIAPDLLLPARHLRSEAAFRALPAWRRERLGDAFFAFLEGRSALRVPDRWIFRGEG